MTQKAKNMYRELGVDTHKDVAKQVFGGGLIHNDYPGAWCNIVRRPRYPGRVAAKHADGSGSKSVTRLLYALVTGDWSVLRQDPFDAFAMNAGDVAASGFVFDDWFVTDIIAINALALEDMGTSREQVLAEIAQGIKDVLKLYHEQGFHLQIFFMGGETADLVDQTSNYTLDMDIYAEADECHVIAGNVQPGDAIFAFASDGQALWEGEPNSGIMSNGQTLGRKGTCSLSYASDFPLLTYHKKPFFGQYQIDYRPRDWEMNIGQALLSPTRQWPIIIRRLMEKLIDQDALHLLHGISMNTGGGLSKVANLGHGIRYVKEIPTPPPIFQLIQSETGETWENMCTAFNCGIGLEVIGSTENEILTTAVAEVGKECDIFFGQLGFCESSRSGDKNEVAVTTPYGTYEY